MRPRRLPRPLLAPLLALACGDSQQGYYGPCDEPVGLGASCPAEGGEPQPFTASDACLKLASCGIIHVEEPPPEDAQDPENYETQFELCLETVRASMDDPGSLLLVCIEDSTCADLSRTEVGEPPPEPNPAAFEQVLGWCERFDPE